MIDCALDRCPLREVPSAAMCSQPAPACAQAWADTDPEDAGPYLAWVHEHRGLVDSRTGQPTMIQAHLGSIDMGTMGGEG